MNRIQMLDQDLNTNSLSTSRRTAAGTNKKQAVEHSFFVPLHYEPNYAYPLVVWLHGPGDGHRQLKQVMPHISLRNYVAVAPGWPQSAGTEQGDSELQSAWSQDSNGIVEMWFQFEHDIFSDIVTEEDKIIGKALVDCL